MLALGSAAGPARAAATASEASDAEEQAAEAARKRDAFAEGPAAIAPMGLTNTHTLAAGHFAASYRYVRTRLDDTRDGNSRDSASKVLSRFQVAPRSRDAQTHLLGLMVAPHDRVTLSLELPIHVLETTNRMRGGGRFDDSTTGIGDLRFTALVPFMRKGTETLQMELGLGIPTGSVTESDQGRTLPYSMQNGSGSVALLPGIVYRGHHESVSWGVAWRSTFHLYQNNRSYRLGDRYRVTSWIAQSWTDWMSTSLRFGWERQARISSRDDTIGYDPTNPSNPEDDHHRYGGDWLEVGPGVNFRVPFLGGPRLGVELLWPFYQDLNGPQLERDWQLTAGWRWDL